MKKLTTIIFIIIIYFPMIFFLNPFAWGMRGRAHYETSTRTYELIHELNKKYNLEMEVGDVIDTVWYFRDIKNNRIKKLENFELILSKANNDSIDSVQIKNYVNDFTKEFEHKKYFDSINIVVNYDSVIYKTKIR